MGASVPLWRLLFSVTSNFGLEICRCLSLHITDFQPKGKVEGGADFCSPMSVNKINIYCDSHGILHMINQSHYLDYQQIHIFVSVLKDTCPTILVGTLGKCGHTGEFEGE